MIDQLAHKVEQSTQQSYCTTNRVGLSKCILKEVQFYEMFKMSPNDPR